jgi:RNA polymerase sigma-70 factor (sigma-E family)
LTGLLYTSMRSGERGPGTSRFTAGQTGRRQRQPNWPPLPFIQCDYATRTGRTPVSGKLDEEFTLFVTARMPSMRRVAYLLCQDWQRADDLVQAAITRLYVRWDRARTMEHTEAYARTILVREYLSEQRSGWARRVSLNVPLPDTADRTVDTDAALDLRAALAALPSRQRATLVLRFYCDLNVDQTAELLGCSAGTVKSQTAKGIGALRGHFGAAAAQVYGLASSPRDVDDQARYGACEVIDHG